MQNLKLKYLGTSAAEGWPGVFCMCESCKTAQKLGGKNLRLRSSLLINEELLVDLSPDLVSFKMKYDIDINKLKAILITHTHLDHFYPQILGYNYKSFTSAPINPLQVYCSSYASSMIKSMMLDNKNALDNIIITELKLFETYSIGDYKITPLEPVHSAPQSFIYLIENNGTTLLYANDTGLLPDSTYKFLENKKLDILSFDATMGLRQESYYRHLSFWDIIKLKDYFIKNNNCNENSIFIATHFSHFIGMTHSEIEKFFDKYNIITAYDGMEVCR